MCRRAVCSANSTPKPLHYTCTTTPSSIWSLISLFLIKQNWYFFSPYFDVHFTKSNPLPLPSHYITSCLQSAGNICAVIATKPTELIVTMVSWQLDLDGAIILACNLLTLNLPCSVWDKGRKNGKWVYVFLTDSSGRLFVCMCVFVCACLYIITTPTVGVWARHSMVPSPFSPHQPASQPANKECPLLGMRLRVASLLWRSWWRPLCFSGRLLSYWMCHNGRKSNTAWLTMREWKFNSLHSVRAEHPTLYTKQKSVHLCVYTHIHVWGPDVWHDSLAKFPITDPSKYLNMRGKTGIDCS